MIEPFSEHPGAECVPVSVPLQVEVVYCRRYGYVCTTNTTMLRHQSSAWNKPTNSDIFIPVSIAINTLSILRKAASCIA